MLLSRSERQSVAPSTSTTAASGQFRLLQQSQQPAGQQRLFKFDLHCRSILFGMSTQSASRRFERFTRPHFRRIIVHRRGSGQFRSIGRQIRVGTHRGLYTTNGTVFQPSTQLLTLQVCEGCGLAIADRYVMRVADGSWHEDCLVCCVCHAPLAHSCFTRSGRIYCRQDYDR